MLKTRIIPVLLLRNGRMVKGRRFRDFRDTGDPISAARIYNAQNADELIFLDIEASPEQRGTLRHIISSVSRECFMPLSVGGGVRSVEDVRALLRAGADKVVINSAALERPKLVGEAAETFGRQCVIVGIDARRGPQGYEIWSHSGRTRQEISLRDHIERVEREGAGEIFINSIDEDGMMAGYDLELLRQVRACASVPVIACGGAGNFQHLADALRQTGVDAVACASVFHFGDNNPIRARSFFKNLGIPVKRL